MFESTFMPRLPYLIQRRHQSEFCRFSVAINGDLVSNCWRIYAFLYVQKPAESPENRNTYSKADWRVAHKTVQKLKNVKILTRLNEGVRTHKTIYADNYEQRRFSSMRHNVRVM